MPARDPAGTELPFAVIGRPRGNRGEVLLHPHFDLRKERLEGEEVVVRWPGGEERSLRIGHLWWHGKRVVCKFAESATIDDAQELRHGELIAPRRLLLPLEADEYFVSDLLGCGVVTLEGGELGRVAEVNDHAGAVVLTVKGERECLIPLARQIVVELDIEHKKLVVDPPAGLLEINED